MAVRAMPSLVPALGLWVSVSSVLGLVAFVGVRMGRIAVLGRVGVGSVNKEGMGCHL